MSWESRYREEAAKARKAAQSQARVGEIQKAQQMKDIAEVYDKLAEEAKERGV